MTKKDLGDLLSSKNVLMDLIECNTCGGVNQSEKIMYLKELYDEIYYLCKDCFFKTKEMKFDEASLKMDGTKVRESMQDGIGKVIVDINRKVEGFIEGVIMNKSRELEIKNIIDYYEQLLISRKDELNDAEFAFIESEKKKLEEELNEAKNKVIKR